MATHDADGHLIAPPPPRPDIEPDENPQFTFHVAVVPVRPLLFELGGKMIRADRIMSVEPDGIRGQHSLVTLEGECATRVSDVAAPFSILLEHVKPAEVRMALNAFAEGVAEHEASAHRRSAIAKPGGLPPGIAKGKRPR